MATFLLVVVWMDTTRIDDDFYGILFDGKDVGEKYQETVKVGSYKRYYKDGSYTKHNVFGKKSPSRLVQILGALLLPLFTISIYGLIASVIALFAVITLSGLIEIDFYMCLYAVSTLWMFFMSDEYKPNIIYRITQIFSVFYIIPLPFKAFLKKIHVFEAAALTCAVFLLAGKIN